MRSSEGKENFRKKIFFYLDAKTQGFFVGMAEHEMDELPSGTKMQLLNVLT